MTERNRRASRTGSCPSRALHTEGPRNYIDWLEWCKEQEKTHTQVRCPGCGFFNMWVRK